VAVASAKHGEEHLSESVSRYLEAIFYMAAEGEHVRGSRLAEWLGVAQPTVTGALRRLQEQDLVRVSPGKEITLTARGETEACRIVRRHRIAERWLTDTLGYDWQRADEEASRIEHALSDDVANRIHALIGHPQTCPHGNHIPGTPPLTSKERSLTTLEPGERSRVRRISEVAEHEAPELLRFLGEQGFHINVPIEVLRISGGAGTMTLRVAEHEVSLSLDVAGRIWIDA
jgi:DtxR family Mn-dependent transcriptional regulator